MTARATRTPTRGRFTCAWWTLRTTAPERARTRTADALAYLALAANLPPAAVAAALGLDPNAGPARATMGHAIRAELAGASLATRRGRTTLARHLGVHPDTLADWITAHPDAVGFLDQQRALARGTAHPLGLRGTPGPDGAHHAEVFALVRPQPTDAEAEPPGHPDTGPATSDPPASPQRRARTLTAAPAAPPTRCPVAEALARAC